MYFTEMLMKGGDIWEALPQRDVGDREIGVAQLPCRVLDPYHVQVFIKIDMKIFLKKP